MNFQKKTKNLVVDTTGFINNAPLHEFSDNIFTTQSVIDEIKSKSQLRRLAVTPYNLIAKEPFSKFVKIVTDFSKKTGDYPSLSATDIDVIALTYQLEEEHVGVEHLRKEPIQKPTIAPGGTPCDEVKNVVGFYVPKGFDLKDADDGQPEDSMNDKCGQEQVTEEVNKLEITVEDEDNDNDEFKDATQEPDGVDDEYSEEEEDDDDDDDDNSWITPSNIKEVKNKLSSDIDDNAAPEVGCLTTDFAMQNVLKQIGLNLVALDGRVIREVRTFILRCYACYKTTSKMDKLFCPNCGNKTLKKVAVTTNADGTQHIHINFRKPLTSRGKRFSLPTPKGGKHANNPILCEDQRFPHQKSSRLSRMKTNALDIDYTAGFSPFVTRDVYSRSAMLGIRPNAQVKQWMKKNPNESTKPGGRKRK